MKWWCITYNFVSYCLLYNYVKSAILLHNTDNSEKTQEYDCIYYDGGGRANYNNMESTQSIKYCVRPIMFVLVNRNYSFGCLNDGILISFDVLKNLNLTSQDLLKWNSGVTVVDRYQAYLNNPRQYDAIMTDFICNCTKSNTFGVLCEYQFLKNSFENTINDQFNLKFNHILGSQLFGTTTCYNTSFECDYGLLCLDWRHICDGKRQCIDGIDEDHCENLLLNECDPNLEYRCRNGMCIDQEYFLDGDFDCQDESDEQWNLFQSPGYACFHIPNLDCDERIMRRKPDFSCGDGESISERVLSLPHINLNEFCNLFRERQWRCEVNDQNPMWTNPLNGHCLDFVDNTTDIDEEINCIFILKCALTQSKQHYLCPCSAKNCTPLLDDYCDSNKSYIFYPERPILTPFVMTAYEKDRLNFENNRQPDLILFIKSIKCNSEMRVVMPTDYWIPYESITDQFAWATLWLPFEFLICYTHHLKNSSAMNYGNCWNDFYPNQGKHCTRYPPYECISKYQVKDGLVDCPQGEDEIDDEWFEDCSSIQKHRFQCSNDEKTCLTINSLGNPTHGCTSNNRDEYSPEKNVLLQNIRCIDKGSVECTFLRQYIENSSLATAANLSSSNSLSNQAVDETVKFWSYCDSLWHANYGVDEMDCSEWQCLQQDNYYQCQTGQCIRWTWLCDGSWDCSDGSDEEGIQRLTEETIGDHNLKLFQSLKTNLTERKTMCLKENSDRPFSHFCDMNYQYPCLLADVEDVLNFHLNPPCIKLTQLGDGHVDCYGGLDERNLLNCSSHEQLGFNFKCDSHEQCIRPTEQCDTNYRCLNGKDRPLCFYLLHNTPINCAGIYKNSTIFDVHCLNGTCMPNSRCTGTMECEFGEDEYYCSIEESSGEPDNYRWKKIGNLHTVKIMLSDYLSFASITDKSEQNINNDVTLQSQSSITVIDKPKQQRALSRQELAQAHSREGWICNRGVFGMRKSFDRDQYEEYCFCPPSYYGDRCQFMSDRLTIFTHFEDQTGDLSNGIIKILALFIMNNNETTTILDHHEFHFTPTLNNLDMKHKFYFVYSRPHQLRTKMNNYSIRFEVFHLKHDETIVFLATWIYSVPFNFFPAQRIAKILKYKRQTKLVMNHTCLLKTNPCLNGGTCHPLMNKFNDTESYWCECQNGSYGSYCEFKDQTCIMNFCSPTSLCRLGYDQNGQKPLCICSMNSYGPRCYLDRQCQMNVGRNPCLNGGICFIDYQHHTLVDAYICKCPKYYFGSKCQYHSPTIRINNEFQNDSFMLSHNEIRASVIQLFDYNDLEELFLKKQAVYKETLPSNTIIVYDTPIFPVIGLMKFYVNESIIHYYLLYIHSNGRSSLNLSLTLSAKNYCPHTYELFKLFNKTDSTAPNMVFKYHNLCKNDTAQLLCFHDDIYICFCDVYNLTQCLRYNKNFDRCQRCQAQGICIQGDLDTPSDYLCLCPQCYFGSMCQYNMKLFSFSLESLLAADLLASSSTKRNVSMSMYLIISILFCLYGIINNLFTFVTFRQPKARINGIAYYLLISSISAQLSLLSLMGKMIYVVTGTRGLISNSIVNIILCKSLSFILSSSTRISHWLTALVTIERVYVVVYPQGQWFKQPKIAQIIITIIIIVLLGSHLHEIIKYNVVNDPKYTVGGTWCVTQFNQFLSIYNQLNTFIHYIVPFIIQVICTIYLIVLIARHRANTDKKKYSYKIFSEKFKEQKELFIPPLILILSGLPQFIISFALTCTNLDDKWQRYLLIVAYFLSYAPQMSIFHLYVQPSTFFMKEFYLTKMGKTLQRITFVKHQ